MTRALHGASFWHLASPVLAFSLLGLTSSARAEVQIQKTLEVPLGEASRVVVVHPLGALSVRGWSRRTARVVARKRGATRRAAQRLRVKVSLAKGVLRIETRLLKRGAFTEGRRLRQQAMHLGNLLRQRLATPKPWRPEVRQEIERLQSELTRVVRAAFQLAAGRRVEGSGPIAMGEARVDLVLYLPRSVSLRAQTLRGDIDVADLAADVRLDARRGRIYARNVQGRLWTRTDHGAQFLSSIRGSVDADGYDGDVQLREVRGRSVVARIVKGGIRAHGVVGPSIRLSTTQGDVVVWATLSMNGVLRVRSFSGHIDARVRAPRGFRYRLRTDRGAVRVPLSSGSRAARGVADRVRRGQVGRGLAGVALRTSVGDVVLRQQPPASPRR